MIQFDGVRNRRVFLRQLAAMGVGAAAIRAAHADPGGTLQKVRIIDTSGLQSETMRELMQSQNFLGKFGLDPEFIDVADGNKVISGLVGGDADICIFSGIGAVLPAIEKGGPLKLVAGSFDVPVHQVYTHDPAIKKVADLKGKIIGIGPLGGLLHQMMVALLSAKGVNPSSVTFVNAGSAADVFRAVLAGKIDAGPADFDYYKPNEGVYVLQDGKIWEQLPDFTNQASYTSERAIKDKRDVLVRTLAAYVTMYRFMESPAGKAPYFDAFFKSEGKKDIAEAQEQWDWIQAHGAYSTDLILSQRRVDYAQKLNLDTGMQKRKLTYEEATDMSMAKDAIALVTSHS